MQRKWGETQLWYLSLLCLLISSTFAVIGLLNDWRPVEASQLSRRVDLNLANTHELSLLPGVGPAMAKDITDNRRFLGPFKGVDDLTRVPGLGEKTLATLKPYVEVSGD